MLEEQMFITKVTGGQLGIQDKISNVDFWGIRFFDGIDIVDSCSNNQSL